MWTMGSGGYVLGLARISRFFSEPPEGGLDLVTGRQDAIFFAFQSEIRGKPSALGSCVLSYFHLLTLWRSSLSVLNVPALQSSKLFSRRNSMCSSSIVPLRPYCSIRQSSSP